MKLEELNHNKNGDKEVVDKLLKSKKPILVYGAEKNAEVVQNYLECHGISVMAFIVDDEYYERDFLINGIKATSIKKYSDNLKEYNVVIGFCNVEKSQFLINNSELLKTNFFLLWEPAIAYEWGMDYLREHWEELMNVYDHLADDLSRQIMSRLIEAKLNFSGVELLKIAKGNQYFNELTFCADSSEEIFVDCGAYNGDTVRQYVKFTNNKYKKIYAFEPNDYNVKRLKKTAESINNIEIIEKGTWSETAVLDFSESGSASQIVEEKGSTKIQVITIDDVVGNDKVTFIKMDVEGSELESLKGGRRVIAKNMPKLAICCYHRRDDIINLYNYIHQFENREYVYKFYLRHHSNNVYETVLYAIPEKKHVVEGA